jgi:hypothetical protein
MFDAGEGTRGLYTRQRTKKSACRRRNQGRRAPQKRTQNDAEMIPLRKGVAWRRLG